MAVISEKLKDLIEAFYEAMASHDDVWVLAIINFEMNNEHYSFNVKFKYAAPSEEVENEVKPWWKIW